MPKDESNPYFTYDPSKCIVCNRCVRACEEVQGTVRADHLGPRLRQPRLARHVGELPRQRVRLLRRLRAGLPTATLSEKALIDIGQPEHSVVTTCAYCGVGCSFKAEMRGEEVVRMVPYKDGEANRGHSCVKGRFAWGYATHKERILKPMMRDKITDPWREVRGRRRSHASPEFKRIQSSTAASRRRHHLVALHQRGDLPRPEADPRRLRQQQRRHLRARLPLADRLRPEDRVRHLGRHAGLRLGRAQRRHLVIGANPTDGHPVFASRMKKRLREGAKLIVVDPRRIDMVRTPHVEAAYHLPLRPAPTSPCSTRWRTSSSPRACQRGFVRERCDWTSSRMGAFVAEPRTARRRSEVSGVPAERSAAPRASMRPAATARSTTASASPSTARARPR
jgi:formate dehydrogenase major subunit